MYQEFNQHKKSDTIKWIVAFSLIIVLMAGVVVSLVISLKPDETQPVEDVIDENTVLTFTEEASPRILLAMSAPLYAPATQTRGASVSYNISAELNPSNVENKMVDWKIEWSEDAPLKDEPIKDYFTLTPTSDGALTATLACVKSFRGSSAILSVTSRDSGVVGTATVTFSGKPGNIEVDVSGIDTQNRGNLAGVLQLKRGETYSRAISLTNVFNDIGPEYNDYQVTVTGIGSFQKGTFNATVSYTAWVDVVDVELNSVKDDYISAKIENGMLVITAKERYENMRGKTTGSSYGGSTKDMYKEDNKDANGNLPYYQIKVTEKTSGMSKTLNVYIVSTVREIRLDKTIFDF